MTKKPAPIWTEGPQYRAGTADPAGGDGGDRIVRYQLSDSSVARDGHTIATAGWVIDNYLRNPIVQWVHALDEPPIGRMVELGIVGDRLMGSIEYPDGETYPFADTIYRLVKGGYLNAVSVSWNPLSWKYSTDRERPGGIDFLRAELLEVSNVPLGAAPAALAVARTAGIDTGPIYAWAEKVLDTGDRVLIPRAELEELRRAAKMPTAKFAALKAPSGFLTADEARLREGMPPPKRADEKPQGDYGDVKYADPGYQEDKKPRYPIDTVEHIKAAWNYINKESNASQYSAAEVDKIKAKISAAWKDKIDPQGPPSARDFAALTRSVVDAMAGAPPAIQRGLCTAAWFLMLLSDLYELTECVAYEEGIEGDDSPAPAAILAAANDLAQAVLGYVSEQIAEAGAGEEDDDAPGIDGAYMMAATAAERRGMLPAILRIAGKASTEPASASVSPPGNDAAQLGNGPLTRAGRVLSAANEAVLRAALDQIRSVVDQVAAPDPAGDLAADIELARQAALLTLAKNNLCTLRHTGLSAR